MLRSKLMENLPTQALCRRSFLVRAALLTTGLLLVKQVRADSTADRLARRVYDRPDGKDATSLVTMTLTEKGRAPRVREMVVYRLKKKAGEINSLIRFTEPADIEGTGLLTHDPADGDSSQWIYLPALDRVRRIDSSRKGGRFVNSDYFFEDLRDRKVEQDTHTIIGRETVAGVACEVLESVPVEAGNSIYTKRVSWIDPATLLPMRIDFYEKNPDRPSKRLQVARREKVQGFWTAMDTMMMDLDSGHQTRLLIERIVYDRKLSPRLFTTQTLADESAEEEFRL